MLIIIVTRTGRPVAFWWVCKCAEWNNNVYLKKVWDDQQTRHIVQQKFSGRKHLSIHTLYMWRSTQIVKSKQWIWELHNHSKFELRWRRGSVGEAWMTACCSVSTWMLEYNHRKFHLRSWSHLSASNQEQCSVKIPFKHSATPVSREPSHRKVRLLAQAWYSDQEWYFSGWRGNACSC